MTSQVQPSQGPLIWEPVQQVKLVSKAADIPAQVQPWPTGYTMTVWGVGIVVFALVAACVSTWVRMGGPARAMTIQTLRWRLSPREWLALRSVARVSGTPAAVLLISRGAFERGVERWGLASAESRPAWAEPALGRVARRIYG